MARSLVVQLARFGDIIQTKRLVLSLASCPDCEVHLCVDRSLASLARIIYPFAVVHEVLAQGRDAADEAAQLSANRETFSTLASIDFDAVYNLNYSGQNFAVAALFAPEIVRGYRWRNGQPLRDQWMELAFRWTRQRRHSPLNLVDFWAGLAPEPVSPGEVNPIALRRGGGIGVVLAGRHSRRSLPMDVLARCVLAVSEGQSLGGKRPRVTLFGSKGERPMARAFMEAADRRVLENIRDLTGRTDWSGLVDSVSELDMLLTPDTGTMHLAAHLGVPVQAFFLSSAWAWETGPYGMGHRVWQAVTDCSPCLESSPCPDDLRCLEAFRAPGFLRALAGKFDPEYPPGMVGLVSRLDSLGVTYSPVFGEDPSGGRREALRGAVSEYLGCGRRPGEAVQADSLYHERDWMLPSERFPEPGHES